MTDQIKPRDWQSQPPHLHPGYVSTTLRAPSQPLIEVPGSLAGATGPVFDSKAVNTLDADLTRNGARNGEPLGERIIVEGRVLGDDGRPVPNTLIEIWQANSAGRYIHHADAHDAPLDPNFFGGGRCATDDDGRYRFLTIKPGAYPWGNHANAWRPNHIHFSLFGPSFATRLITQMYFPGDPLLDLDPIFLGVPESARARLIAGFSLDTTREGYALGYAFDIVLRGRDATPMEN